MVRRLALVVPVLLGTLSPLAAQDTAALAEKYMKLPAMQVMLDSILGPGFIEPMMAAMGGPGLPQEKREKLVKIIGEEMAVVRPGMEKAMIDAAAQTYTAAELEAMIAFNSTPEAASIMKKLQTFNAAYLARFGPSMQVMQSKIQQRAMEELKP